MKFISEQSRTICTFEMSSKERLILIGLLTKIINKEELDLDDEVINELTYIRKGLSRY